MYVYMYMYVPPHLPSLFPPSMLATKLNLSADDAERWIVNLIRNARLDAKIDAKQVTALCMCKLHFLYTLYTVKNYDVLTKFNLNR